MLPSTLISNPQNVDRSLYIRRKALEVRSFEVSQEIVRMVFCKRLAKACILWSLQQSSRPLAPIKHPSAFHVALPISSVRPRRIEGISLLEACRNSTLVHFANGNILLRRSLGSIERRLDSSMFFRASRSSIVNLGHVKQPRLSKDGRSCFRSEGREGGRVFSPTEHSLP